MNLLLALIVGAVVGWIAASLAGRKEGFFGSVAIGIVGAFIGGILSSIISGSMKTYLDFTWSGLFWSLIGSLVLVALLNSIQHKSHHRAL